MSDYAGMTQDDFDRLLTALLDNATSDELLSIPRLYEVVSEHYNNEILSRWQDKQDEQRNEGPVCPGCGDSMDVKPSERVCSWCQIDEARKRGR